MPLLMRGLRVIAVAPFSLHFTTRILQRLPTNRVDLWDGHVYQRLLPVGGRLELISVTRAGTALRPALEVRGSFSAAEAALVRHSVERLLGLRVDLRPFYRLMEHTRLLRPVAAGLRGMKPPRFLTLFEALVNALCCQQLSLTVGILMMGKVAELAGCSRVIGGRTYLAFPPAERVASLRHDRLKNLGLSGAKASSLTGVAREFSSGRFQDVQIEALDTPAALERLQQLPGIGPWSARYALLRGAGRLDVFPSGDSGAARALSKLLGRTKMTPDEAVSLSTHWKEYAGLLYFHLLGNRYRNELGADPWSVAN